jgi:hypothetical protein
MTIARHAVAARAVAAAAVVLLGGLTWAIAGTTAAGVAAGVAAVTAVAGALWPASPAPLLALLALAGGFTSASADVSDVVLLPWAATEAAALWTVHQLFAFASAVPLDAAVDRRAVRRLGANLLLSLALVVPAVALVLLAEDAVRAGEAVRVLGVLGAIGACALPVYLLRADRTG